MSTNRAKQLEKLSMSLPKQNQQIAQGQQAARTVQLQEQIKNLPQGAGGPALAQNMGAQQAQQAGQIQVGAQQKNLNQQQLVGQMGLEQKARGQRQEGFEQKIELSQRQRKFANQLSKLDIDMKNKLLDAQLEFKKDQAGQTLLNERQMLDYAIKNAKSQEQFKDWAQSMEQATRRKLQIMETANRKLEIALKRGYTENKKKLDRESYMRIREAKEAIERKIRDEKNRAKNRFRLSFRHIT